MTVGRKINDLWEVADNSDVVVNCTGAWAGELAKDKAVAPLRGQVHHYPHLNGANVKELNKTVIY